MDIKKKIDQVKQELQKFVEGLKSKFEKNKKSNEEEKTKPDIASDGSSNENVTNEEQNTTSENESNEDLKKKEKPKFTEQDLKRKKIIQVIVVLAIAVFLFAPDEEVIKEVQKSVESKIGEVVNKEGEDGTVSLPINESQEIPGENPQQDELSEKQLKDKQIIEEKEKTIEVSIDEEPSSSRSDENIKLITPKKDKKGSLQRKVTKNQVAEQPSEKPMAEVGQGENDILDFAKKIQKKAEQESKIKTIQKVNYLKVGRGLAYNCKEKFWACLNKEQYFNCRDNQERFDLQKKARECYPLEVYSSVEDCKIIQIHNINILKKTDFCKGL